jgi:glycosyltransferase involved in cell wall biosynthesis
LKILIVSGEYPPMKGGVGRYTSHLVDALRNGGKKMDVHIGTGAFQSSHRAIDHRSGFSQFKDAVKTNLATHHNNGDDTEKDRKHVGIIRKGDRKNSDRLLNLVQELKPDVINIQYERGLYEVDTSVFHMTQRLLHGSTLNKFYQMCKVPVVSTLHTVLPYDEYQRYIKERALRKEGRFAFLPLQLRTAVRKWVLQRRYELLFEVVNLSDEIISLATVIQEIIRRGTVIYHGAEPASPLVSSVNKWEFRKEFGLPDDKKLLLAFGYVGSYKGFDILENINLPSYWSLVTKQNIHERGSEMPASIKKNAINLNLGPVDDLTLSKLFFACDAIILPYKVVSISGVLFDALAHGLPFIASDLRFFREFSAMDLGITCNRSPESFSESIKSLDADFDRYKKNVQRFSPKLRWDTVANNHIELYSRITSKTAQ